MIRLIVGMILAYLIGSFPTAFLFAKFLKGVDIRKVGSGNVGATNVYRSVGKLTGFAVLFIDILKGAIPVFLFPPILQLGFDSNPELPRILIGSSAIIGHVWTVFLRFKGGKGVATTAGVLLALSPKVLGCAFIVWVIIFAISKYVSLASIIAASLLPIFGYFFTKNITLTIFFTIVAILGILKHKSNISRLLNGTEHKVL